MAGEYAGASMEDIDEEKLKALGAVVDEGYFYEVQRDGAVWTQSYERGALGDVDGDKVVIRWVFRFEWLDGTITQMEELAYQRWEGERIAEETFFYDPAQRAAQKSNP